MKKDKVHIILPKILKEVEGITKSSAFGEFGLKGNSGFVSGRHISSPYDCNGLIFAEKGDWWQRMKPEDITNEKIIKCSYCEKPAVRLDHYFMTSSKETACRDHINEHEKQKKRRKGDK